MPSADIRSNRCVPLRGTSAGYASASSASIKFLKSVPVARGIAAFVAAGVGRRWSNINRRYIAGQYRRLIIFRKEAAMILLCCMHIQYWSFEWLGRKRSNKNRER